MFSAVVTLAGAKIAETLFVSGRYAMGHSLIIGAGN
jgi:hypothetical protein